MSSSELGSRLKQAREASGVDLREIATITKISVASLEALERGDFSRLPGGIFARSFVRSYATTVGLDPEETVAEFLEALRESQRDAERNARTPEITADDRAFLARQQRALRLAQYGGIALLVVLVIAVLWWIARPAPPPAPEDPPAPAAESPPDPPPPVTPQPPPIVDPPVTPPADPPAAAAAPAADDLTLEFDFVGRCWVALTADGAIDVRRLFVPGERHTVRATEEIVLNVGDAGAFRWTINGRPARPLGRAGATREVRITRENYSTFLQ